MLKKLGEMADTGVDDGPCGHRCIPLAGWVNAVGYCLRGVERAQMGYEQACCDEGHTVQREAGAGHITIRAAGTNA